MLKYEVEKLLASKIRDYKGRPALYFHSGRMDFEVPYLFFGVTKSGNVILGDIYAEGPQGIKYQKRIVKPTEYKGEIYLKAGQGTGTNFFRLIKASND